jgi:rod shape-determining protein MreD
MLLFAVAALIALAVQTTVPLWFPYRVLIPNLVVILAVDLGLRHHGIVPAVLAFAMGYATDAFSGTHPGLHAFLITLVFLFAYEVSCRLMATNVFIGALAVFIGVIIEGVGAVAIGSGRPAVGALGAVVPGVLMQAVASAVVAPLVFGILATVKRWLGLRKKARRE